MKLKRCSSFKDRYKILSGLEIPNKIVFLLYLLNIKVDKLLDYRSLITDEGDETQLKEGIKYLYENDFLSVKNDRYTLSQAGEKYIKEAVSTSAEFCHVELFEKLLTEELDPLKTSDYSKNIGCCISTCFALINFSAWREIIIEKYELFEILLRLTNAYFRYDLIVTVFEKFKEIFDSQLTKLFEISLSNQQYKKSHKIISIFLEYSYALGETGQLEEALSCLKKIESWIDHDKCFGTVHEYDKAELKLRVCHLSLIYNFTLGKKEAFKDDNLKITGVCTKLQQEVFWDRNNARCLKILHARDKAKMASLEGAYDDVDKYIQEALELTEKINNDEYMKRLLKAEIYLEKGLYRFMSEYHKKKNENMDLELLKKARECFDNAEKSAEFFNFCDYPVAAEILKDIAVVERYLDNEENCVNYMEQAVLKMKQNYAKYSEKSRRIYECYQLLIPNYVELNDKIFLFLILAYRFHKDLFGEEHFLTKLAKLDLEHLGKKNDNIEKSVSLYVDLNNVIDLNNKTCEINVFKNVIKSVSDKKIFCISGPPGSGKMELALYLAREHLKKIQKKIDSYEFENIPGVFYINYNDVENIIPFLMDSKFLTSKELEKRDGWMIILKDIVEPGEFIDFYNCYIGEKSYENSSIVITTQYNQKQFTQAFEKNKSEIFKQFEWISLENGLNDDDIPKLCQQFSGGNEKIQKISQELLLKQNKNDKVFPITILHAIELLKNDFEDLEIETDKVVVDLIKKITAKDENFPDYLRIISRLKRKNIPIKIFYYFQEEKNRKLSSQENKIKIPCQIEKLISYLGLNKYTDSYNEEFITLDKSFYRAVSDSLIDDKFDEKILFEFLSSSIRVYIEELMRKYQKDKTSYREEKLFSIHRHIGFFLEKFLEKELCQNKDLKKIFVDLLFFIGSYIFYNTIPAESEKIIFEMAQKFFYRKKFKESEIMYEHLKNNVNYRIGSMIGLSRIKRKINQPNESKKYLKDIEEEVKSHVESQAFFLDIGKFYEELGSVDLYLGDHQEDDDNLLSEKNNFLLCAEENLLMAKYFFSNYEEYLKKTNTENKEELEKVRNSLIYNGSHLLKTYISIKNYNNANSIAKELNDRLKEKTEGDYYSLVAIKVLLFYYFSNKEYNKCFEEIEKEKNKCLLMKSKCFQSTEIFLYYLLFQIIDNKNKKNDFCGPLNDGIQLLLEDKEYENLRLHLPKMVRNRLFYNLKLITDPILKWEDFYKIFLIFFAEHSNYGYVVKLVIDNMETFENPLKIEHLKQNYEIKDEENLFNSINDDSENKICEDIHEIKDEEIKKTENNDNSNKNFPEKEILNQSLTNNESNKKIDNTIKNNNKSKNFLSEFFNKFNKKDKKNKTSTNGHKPKNNCLIQ